MHSFFEQIIIKYLLCAKHSSSIGHIVVSKADKKSLPLLFLHSNSSRSSRDTDHTQNKEVKICSTLDDDK